ncbi:MAG: bifunctional UDP-sugar hydrolase/5'-nucleotidase [Smithella sp.]
MKQILIFIFNIIFSIFLLQHVCSAQPVDLRILYLNDFHGFAEPYQTAGNQEQLGGIAFLAAEANRLRQERSALFLSAGDMIQGNPWTNLFEGKSTIEIMNLMEFSAMVTGNHEFDYGQDVLQKRIQEARFPVLAANIQGVTGIKPYVINEIAGLKVAIIGLITEETPVTTHPRNVKGLKFLPAAEIAKRTIDELRNKSDLVIVLSHLGLPADVQLAKAVQGIDLIVGGHSHTRVEKPIKIENTLIVQAWEHAKVLGILDLTIQDKKIIHYAGQLSVIQPDKNKADPLILEIVNRYQKQTDVMLNEVIGETRVDLEGKGSRFQETNLGNLIADILREETKADLAMINGGGIRSDILKGNIRMKDIFSALPFTNHPVVLKVSGQEIKDIFEYGVSDPDQTGGRFPQVSGIIVSFNPAHPGGQKVIDIKIGNRPLRTDAYYTLTTNDFLAAGGDGYTVFKKIMESRDDGSTQSSRVILFDSGREIRDMVIDFIKAKKRVSAKVEGRIQKEK